MELQTASNKERMRRGEGEARGVVEDQNKPWKVNDDHNHMQAVFLMESERERGQGS